MGCNPAFLGTDDHLVIVGVAVLQMILKTCCGWLDKEPNSWKQAAWLKAHLWLTGHALEKHSQRLCGKGQAMQQENKGGLMRRVGRRRAKVARLDKRLTLKWPMQPIYMVRYHREGSCGAADHVHSLSRHVAPDWPALGGFVHEANMCNIIHSSLVPCRTCSLWPAWSA